MLVGVARLAGVLEVHVHVDGGEGGGVESRCHRGGYGLAVGAALCSTRADGVAA